MKDFVIRIFEVGYYAQVVFGRDLGIILGWRMSAAVNNNVSESTKSRSTVWDTAVCHQKEF
jgi:hypothetical protein